jgi:hypothetical protein
MRNGLDAPPSRRAGDIGAAGSVASAADGLAKFATCHVHVDEPFANMLPQIEATVAVAAFQGASGGSPV